MSKSEVSQKSEQGDTVSLSDRELGSSWQATRRLYYPIRGKTTKCWRI